MAITTFDSNQFDADFSRMMKSYGGVGKGCNGVNCCDCPLLGEGCGRPLNPVKAIRFVTEWAAANPEPPPEIDWFKVPPDTEVLVWDCVAGKKLSRRFALFLPSTENKFWCFGEGDNQSSASSTTCWSACELANKEDIEKYRKR